MNQPETEPEKDDVSRLPKDLQVVHEHNQREAAAAAQSPGKEAGGEGATEMAPSSPAPNPDPDPGNLTPPDNAGA